MKKFINTGLPLESGIRAALRHHQKQVKLHKVQKMPNIMYLHNRAISALTKLLPDPEKGYGGRGYVTRKLLADMRNEYLQLHLVANPKLLGIVPAELLYSTGELNIEACRRRDVLDMILHDEKGS